MYEHYEFLRVDVDDGIAVVTLDRPEYGNAFTHQGHKEMSHLWRDVARDRRVRAAVLAAEGRVFCAGPDHEYLRSLMDPVNTELRLEATSDALEMVQSAIDLEKPVITAMSGVAHGGGLAFSLLCDILIVEEHVTIRDGHVLAGIAAGDGGTLIWPAAIGLSRAKRYLLTGDPISAQEAVEFGLAAECVERGESLPRALEFATRFAAGPQLAIQSTKRALNQLLRAASTTSFYYSWALELVTMGSPDSASAVDALGRRLAGPMPSDPRARR